MPTDWTDKVRAAITNLETKGDRVLGPDQALAIIDDVVESKFAAADLATIHGVPQAWIRRRGSNEGHTRGRVDAGRADDGTLTFSGVVRIWLDALAQRRYCRRVTVRTWPFRRWHDRRRSVICRSDTA
jgi:hypothetical protein